MDKTINTINTAANIRNSKHINIEGRKETNLPLQFVNNLSLLHQNNTTAVCPVKQAIGMAMDIWLKLHVGHDTWCKQIVHWLLQQA